MGVTLGSLFDGIGGALLSAEMCGITPVWASEIEPFPIKVTEHHFPNVLHLGDITEIDGSKIEPVDIIVGGSPCQDISVAGKRAGLGGERSGLFMEQIRIVKEMRDATNGFFPRYMVWENVAGAFSSNKGDDFRIVLEEIAKIAQGDVSIPQPNKRWAKAGSILGDGWSISWRTFDAQFWGVPQRRRRIYLVADFRGSTAPEILFEQPCVSGDIAESRGKREGVAGDSEGGTGEAGFGEAGVDRCNCLTPWDNQSKRIFDPAGSYPTLQAMNGGGANNTAVILRANAVFCGDQHSAVSYDMTHADDVIRDMGEVTQTLQHRLGTGGNQVPITMTYSYQRSDQLKESNVSCTQSARQHRGATDLVIGGFNGQTKKTNTSKILQLLQGEIGEKDLSEWGFRVLASLQQKKILQQEMYGKIILQTRNGIKVLGHDALEGKAEEVARQMRDLSEAECERCSPQRRKSPKQLTREFATYMSELSQQDSPKERYLQDMWDASQGAWILREALPEIQKIWESICVQKKSTYAIGSVRRLTAKECCRLQGLPDNWTNIEGASDTARYKALGNSFAIPNILFVISRIKENIDERILI